MLPCYKDVRLGNAHDVRHLVKCRSCGGIGDKRRMLANLEAAGLEAGPHHGRCVVQRLGDDAVLALPQPARNKLTLADTGTHLMRRLLAESDASSAAGN